MRETPEEKVSLGLIQGEVEKMGRDIRILSKAVLTGNGSESLITRVGVIESKVSTLCDRFDRVRQFWFWLPPVVISVVAVALSVLTVLYPAP